MASITEVSYWLRSLKLLWINMWERIDTMGQVLLTCSRVDADSWWSRRQYKYTAILRGRERRYVKLTFFASIYFSGYARNRSRFKMIGRKYTHRGTTSLNGCTSYSKYLYGYTSGYYWLHQYLGSGFGVWWIWQPIVRHLLEIYR